MPKLLDHGLPTTAMAGSPSQTAHGGLLDRLARWTKQ